MNDPVQESLVVSGSSQEEIFGALLDVERFPEWAFGLKEARTLGAPTNSVAPGTTVEFALSAAGITHRVAGTVSLVEPPRLLLWRYTEGAAGMGGWILEDLGYAVKVTFRTSYEVKPPRLNRLANRPFFRGVTEDLLRRSMRRFADLLRGG
jgi:uncharacterized protein YndB with AHSA1/START domain